MRWAILLLLPVFLACRSDGERLVDELSEPLARASAVLSSGEGTPEERGSRALDLLERETPRIRMLQSKLDDVVRTLNKEQKQKLADYARARLPGVER